MRYPTFDELFRILPETLQQNLENCIQDPRYHGEGSVANHMRLVFDQLLLNFSHSEHFPLLSLAVIFHDIAKPETKTIGKRPDGTTKIQHIGHETACLKYISDLLPRYVSNFSEVYRDVKIEDLRYICANHMIAHVWREAQEGKGKINKKRPRWKVFETHPLYPVLMMFAECDERGRII